MSIQLNIILKENLLIYVQVERVYLLSNILLSLMFILYCLKVKATGKNALQLEFI